MLKTTGLKEAFSNIYKAMGILQTLSSESPAGLFISHPAFRGRDADEVALENPYSLSAS